ncbi:tripartite tricarboxylate transporter substrate binding protein [Micromonospora sp. DR5-3]|uniref:Bug family tripartite tricarboxylate transporter substrate binding protein n=1 Tax=unclassified Micromonospora TaxID=2617518 RepID=UPI0011DAA71B|nr:MULTISPECIES: tripartite tricarboxylate transporter substrate binding protein [unclassified Micromonospora]MCW3815894.1 tripartite tricarboxylate transporter substrate binding protein [Micromonospora sp. DR5-3]TYC24405.1 tripartite tricarboxylate transporter substrate binding protein [Micromonospora sp. MP36]
MRITRTGTIAAVLAALVATVSACGGGSAKGGGDQGAKQLARLNIIAPAAPGSGWDQTARAVQDSLQKADLARQVEVTNVPGASGTVALAQVAPQKGKKDLLIMSGLAMMSGVLTNGTDVTLDDLTPVARLIGEYETIVVPASSPYQKLDDLLAAIKADPKKVPIAGGSAGSADQIFIGLLAKEAGIDPAKVNYVPFSGGGEATTALLGNKVAAGVAGTGEFQEQVKAGKLRALVVSAAKPVESMPGVPTIADVGHPGVEFYNWRSIMAPNGLTAEQKKAYVDAVTAMHASDGWKTTLKERAWEDTFLAGDEFGTWLGQEQTRVSGVLTELGLVK